MTHRKDEDAGNQPAKRTAISTLALGREMPRAPCRGHRGLCDLGRDRGGGRGLHRRERDAELRRGRDRETVEVAVLDDSHDEGSETMMFTLSNASGAAHRRWPRYRNDQ